jgi:hypothetical protein
VAISACRPAPSRPKTIDYPHVGALSLDRDALSVTGSDLRIMVYTARPGSQDVDCLALLDVVGTQSFVGCPLEPVHA